MLKKFISKIINFNKHIPLIMVTINKTMIEQGLLKDSCTFKTHPCIQTLDKEVQKKLKELMFEMIDIIRDNVKAKDL